VKTRMINQVGEEYIGFVDCLLKPVRKERVMALWEGIFPHLGKVGAMLSALRSTPECQAHRSLTLAPKSRAKVRYNTQVLSRET
jgi:hypothetical protein